jgi:hypothetical protein
MNIEIVFAGDSDERGDRIGGAGAGGADIDDQPRRRQASLEIGANERL